MSGLHIPPWAVYHDGGAISYVRAYNIGWRRPDTPTLNLFRRSVLEAIGGLDENYIFGFAEPIILLKIRSLGLRAVMVGDTHAFHCDQLTKLLGESSLDSDAYLKDVNRWFTEYADYASSSLLASIDFRRWPFATTRSIQGLWWLCRPAPSRALRTRLIKLTMWPEPFFTRYPARRGVATQPRAS